MAASLVQPNCVCTCNCAGHVHHHQHDRHSYGAPGFAGYPVLTGYPSPTGAFHNDASSAPAEQHTFTTTPAVTAASGVQDVSATEPRVYPFKGGHVKHTHASFRRDSLPELSPTNHALINGHAETNSTARPSKAVLPTPITPLSPFPSQVGASQAKAINSWTLCLPIPIPHGLPNTTLESLMYTIRYASLNAGNASVQTDVVLAHGPKMNVEGVATDYAKVPLYSHYGSGATGEGEYGPPMLNEALGLALLSVPAFKRAGGNGGWSHYLDHQKVYPNVRIEEGEAHASTAVHSYHAGHAHTQTANGCHVYLFFHVYEYPGPDALRSISVDVSATWNDGETLQKVKDERAREVKELRTERERMALMKREAELTIGRLEEAMKRANEENERRIKGKIEIERELKEREGELLEFEKKAKEMYKGRMSEEAERLRKLEEKEKEAQALYAKRAKEEEGRLKAFKEAETEAKVEHERRMKAEEERLKEIADAEERVRAEHLKRVSEEEARMKEIEEAQRKLKEEAERKAKENAERHAREEAEWKAHEEAERKAREDQERWAKEQAMLRQKEEEERRARIEAERKVKEEAERRAKEEAERKAKEEVERREAERRAKEEADRKEAERKAKEEAERKEADRKAKEEADRKAKEEADRKTKEEVEHKAKEEAERKAKEEADRKAKAAARVVPKISEAPMVADADMQEHIAAVAAKMGQKCKNGYEWEKHKHGYKCRGGGHFISFKDLGMQ